MLSDKVRPVWFLHVASASLYAVPWSDLRLVSRGHGGKDDVHLKNNLPYFRQITPWSQDLQAVRQEKRRGPMSQELFVSLLFGGCLGGFASVYPGCSESSGIKQL